MLALGGAEVELAGFLRGPTLPDIPFAAKPMDLGHSADARLGQRVLSVGRVLSRGMEDLLDRMDGVDALVARNLEMLVIARALQRRMGGRPRLVYEILDLHRLLTARGPLPQSLRLIEARLGRSVDLAITSSPAFVTRHLNRLPFAKRIIFVENKVLVEGPRLAETATPPAPPPFRIGWFGALRCQRSFALLADLASRMNGKVEVVLAGRPTTAVFPDLAAMVAQVPHMRFHGPYQAADLPALYGDVHFSWCLDFYEAGANSDWLLPNRLYESAAHLAVPIALATVETGRFLHRHNLGIVLDRADPAELADLFGQMTADRHARLQRALALAPSDLWFYGPQDCRALVAAITGTEEKGRNWQRVTT